MQGEAQVLKEFHGIRTYGIRSNNVSESENSRLRGMLATNDHPLGFLQKVNGRPCQHAIAAFQAYNQRLAKPHEDMVRQLYDDIWLTDTFLDAVLHSGTFRIGYSPHNDDVPRPQHTDKSYLPPPSKAPCPGSLPGRIPSHGEKGKKISKRQGSKRKRVHDCKQVILRNEEGTIRLHGEAVPGFVDGKFYTVKGNLKKTCKICKAIGHNKRSCTSDTADIPCESHVSSRTQKNLRASGTSVGVQTDAEENQITAGNDGMPKVQCAYLREIFIGLDTVVVNQVKNMVSLGTHMISQSDITLEDLDAARKASGISVHCCGTYFYTKLIQEIALCGDADKVTNSVHAGCRKWIKDIWVEGNDTTSELPTMERMGGVLRDQKHWGLVTIDLRSIGHVAVTLYDSMKLVHKECTKDIACFVEMEWQRQLNEAQSTGNQLLEAWMQDKLRVKWQHVYSFTSDLVPRQTDGSSCGVFVCAIADCIASGRNPATSFCQKDIPDIRMRIGNLLSEVYRAGGGASIK
ncbi:hypothetical protein GUITHDRAFT_132208 [Guillardia theta CCMP2712]|uniref:Ubiquitin-like protease family profile domain-containing protein n=1 Tax=Guillardia theta (strain CCMP2712) TaxID=905079 RepID=L1K1P1_GUITC|nr:hypothetical protein GUITHDRAFT_132208 [Guillardia theta CCMP2712]EKX54489.1 hypothetical protein GUITHDRAFT_132208 [Guillardia theta CCMP2712]|eukprot:XP_005841469.1 hypothetical protein GUITHDRAFT_132208 [Guillardia theta CCMP2712]